MLISGNFVIEAPCSFSLTLVTERERLAYSLVSGSVKKLTSVTGFEYQIL